MCEFLAFLMVLFGCEVCDSNGMTNLTITRCGKNCCCIELENDVPVRGVQFTLACDSRFKVETTSRTEEFLVQYNEKNGTVVCVSLSGARISPGAGTILKIIFDDGWGGGCHLWDIKISE